MHPHCQRNSSVYVALKNVSFGILCFARACCRVRDAEASVFETLMGKRALVVRDAEALASATPLQRLNDFRSRTPWVSQAALSSILTAAKRAELPSLNRRAQIRRARDDVVNTMTPYGKVHKTIVVPSTSVENVVVEVQCPWAMFWLLCRTSQSWSSLVARTLDSHDGQPNSVTNPWGLVLYNDEITMGNQLRKDNRRKVEGFYWSIFNFGSDVLSDEMAWLEVCAVRSTTRKRMSAGLSGLFAAILQTFFADGGPDMSLAGINVELFDHRHVHIWIALQTVLADESATHGSLGCKGASGFKICCQCKNTFHARYVADPDALRAAGGVLHTCADISMVALQTDESIWAIIDRLRAQKSLMGRGEFQELQLRLGWNHVEGGLLQQEPLRRTLKPYTNVSYDFMHILFVNGCFNLHCGLFFHAIKPFGITNQGIDEYVSQWKWPGSFDKISGRDAFSDARFKSCKGGKPLSVSASEGLSLTPVLALFVTTKLLGHENVAVRAQARLFLMLVNVIELIVSTTRVVVPADVLDRHVKAYLEEYLQQFGEEDMIPKMHYLIHVSLFLRRWGRLLNCWVHERKHKIIKRFGNPMTNVHVDYSASVLREVTNYHVTVMRNEVRFTTEAVLIDEVQPPKALLRDLRRLLGGDLHYTVAHSCRFNRWETVTLRDIVLYRSPAGTKVAKVERLVAVSEDAPEVAGRVAALYCLASELPITGCSDRCITTGGAEATRLIDMDDILHTTIWSHAEAGYAVMIPMSARAAALVQG